jgi:hypothetical protein
MILDQRSAAIFIDGYKKLLLEICGPTEENLKLLERLVEGRKKLMSDASLLDATVSNPAIYQGVCLACSEHFA